MRRLPFLFICALSFILACGGGSGATNNPNLGIQLELDPIAAALNSGESRTYVANVRIPGVGVNLYSDARFGIEWSVTGGSLAPVPGQDIAWRTYTAPQGTGTYQVTLRSTYNPSTQITATVNVAPPPLAQDLVPARTSLYQGDSTSLLPTFSAGTGKLEPGGLTVTSGAPIQVSPMRTTQYSLVVTNSIGKTATKTCSISVQARGVFSPLATWNPFNTISHGEGLLPDGKVLVVAENGVGISPFKSYILDPETWQFTSTKWAPSGYYRVPSAVPMGDGRLLIYGSDAARYSVAEVFNPTDETFSPVDTTSMGDDPLVAALQLGGGHLVLAGFKGVASFQSSGQKLGPVTPYPANFSFSRVVPYADTRALFISYGGSFYLYDAATATFTPLTGLPPGLGSPTVAVRLKTGKIFLAGSIWDSGVDGNQTYLLDPANGIFTGSDRLLVRRDEYTIPVLLNDGRVLLSGIRLDTNPTEIYDPAIGTSCQLPNLDSMVGSSRATVLSDGRVLFLGSTTGAVFNPALTPPATPRLGSFSLTGSLKVARAPGALTRLTDGTVLVTGGSIYDSTPNQKVVERFDPVTGTFQRLGDQLVSRTDHSATLLPSGKVLLFGGGGGHSGGGPVAEIYDPATGTSVGLSYVDWSRVGNKAVRLNDGRICLVGGGPEVLIFDPAIEQIRSLGSISAGNEVVGAALLPNGKVLLSSGEIFDPATGLTESCGSKYPGFGAELVALGNGTVLGLTNMMAEVFSPAVMGYLPTGGLLHSRDSVPPVLLADGTVLLLGAKANAPTQIFLPSLNGNLGGFISGPLQLPIHTPFPKGVILNDGRVLVVSSGGCQIYTP
jgi:hypothetical protein